MKTENKVIALSIILGLSAGALDSLVDYFIFYEKPFWDLLIFDVPMFEIYVRGMILVTFTVYGIIVSRILTKRKQAEEKIKQQSEFLNSVLESLSHPFYVVDVQDYSIKLANAAAHQGRLSKDSTCYALTHLSDKPCGSTDHSCPIEIIKKTKQPVTVEHIHYDKDRNPRNVEVHGYPIFDADGNVSQIIEYSLDVTNRKKEEEALRESEEKYHRIFENSVVGFFQSTPEGRFIIANSAFAAMLRYESPDELVSKISDIATQYYADPEDRRRYKELLQKSTVVMNFEFKVKCKDGSQIWVSNSSRAYFNPDGEVDHYEGIVIDITDRKQAEAELINTKNFLQNILNSSTDGIATTDLHGKVTYCAPNLQDMIGYEPKEIIGKKMAAFYSNGIQDAKRVMTILMEKGELTNYETKFKKTDGTQIDAMLSASLLRNERGEITGTLGIFKDITDKKRLEKGLIRAEKLESVGILAGGIAHDFNNLLTIILGNISMAKGDETKGEILELLNEAEKASLKATGLSHQLITFSKGGAPVKKIASIVEFAKKSINFALSGSKVRCESRLPGDLWLVDYDENQMEHVIKGLIKNAVEAMPEGGIIKLFAENLMMNEEKEVRSLNLQKGKCVKISIQDQGCGISEEILPRIFEPYFSTKERGDQKGMGLGLATAYSIISKHKGHIGVDSKKDVGTTFHIYLPAFEEKDRQADFAEDRSAPIEQDFRSTSKINKGQASIKRVLVMDDEESLRKLVKRMLIRFGYEVGLARDGAEAIALYKEALRKGQRYDAVILDLSIKGGMGGEQAIKELSKIDPNVKAIISSGYFNDPVMSNFMDYGFRGAMPKPYEQNAVEKAIGEILSQKDEKK